MGLYGRGDLIGWKKIFKANETISLILGKNCPHWVLDSNQHMSCLFAHYLLNLRGDVKSLEGTGTKIHFH
uniref:Putative ovule protein n=1 Tax=Solanum chacoense TaxID=4108 RepID=A0A0V0I315_SOLCH